MRIDLDGNALFTAFEKFVSDQRNGTTSKAVARIGEGEHLIVAATNDKVGPLWRRQSNKSANDQIRETFRNMLVNIFEGEENIPESVRAVMKEFDYGQGKPLTARRISAVCRAVRECAEREAQTAQIQEDAGKAEMLGRLFRGESVAQIVGAGRDGGWDDLARNLGDMLVLVAAHGGTVAEGAEVTLINPFGGNTVMSLGNEGKVSVSITVGDQTCVVDTGKTPQELADAANRALQGMDDAFGDVQYEGRGMGRCFLASRMLPNLQMNGSSPDSEPCVLRTFAGALLIAKAGATQELVNAFDNEQLANFAHVLLGNAPEHDAEVKAAMEQAVRDRGDLAQIIAAGLDKDPQIIEPQQVAPLELNVPPPPPPPPDVPVIEIPKAPPGPQKVPDSSTLPYKNAAAEKTTTYEATIVANRFATKLAATRTNDAEAAV